MNPSTDRLAASLWRARTIPSGPRSQRLALKHLELRGARRWYANPSFSLSHPRNAHVVFSSKRGATNLQADGQPAVGETARHTDARRPALKVQLFVYVKMSERYLAQRSPLLARS